MNLTNKWIDVNDQLPPRDTWVIGWWKTDPNVPFIKGMPFVFQLELIAKDKTIEDFRSKVSHWTRLPDPPKEEDRIA